MECGPTALRIVAKYYGKHISSIKAQELCFLSREGSSLLNLSNAAENIQHFEFQTHCLTSVKFHLLLINKYS